ncbi:MAG: hypothetical protein HYV42_01285 [Candidatus Magasanikbacteria bacterium]|nr:hypothetical protein [Candidatus Magasanikbacteria bacterium]
MSAAITRAAALGGRPAVSGNPAPRGSLSRAVFLLTGTAIGAGVYGLPYAFARFGMVRAALALIILGIAVLGLHLLLGEVVARTREPLQLPGLGGKYVGVAAKRLLSLTFLVTSLGALLAYLVGEGEVLQAIWGGKAHVWSLGFWFLVVLCLSGGLRRVAGLEKFLSSLVMALLLGLSLLLFTRPAAPSLPASPAPFSALLLLYGVAVFSLRAAPAIAEAEAIIPGEPGRLRQAVVLGTLLPLVLYLLFAVSTARVLGGATPEVATVGLGGVLSPLLARLLNLLPALSMAGAALALGTAVIDSLRWDWRLPRLGALLVVGGVPLLAYALGARSFIGILEVVGGIFVGLEALALVLVYQRARRAGDVSPGAFALRRPALAIVPIVLIFGGFTLWRLLALVRR